MSCYGLDWLMFVLLLWHLWLLGNKHRSAFLVGIFATLVGVAVGWLLDSYAIMVMNVVFCGMHLRAYFKWT